MNYLIKTYGCQMNVHESEKLSGILEQLGYKCVESENDADIIVFNTCAIRESAEQKIFAHIGELKKLKHEKPSLIIAICGCMTQQKGYAETLIKKFPFVDIVFGTHNLSSFKELLEKRRSTNKKVVEITETENIKNRDTMPKKRTSGVNAWVNIMYGCNNFCTYCIVPYVRGREVSRPEEEIICEVEHLVKEGYKQITLLGQNVNSYGNDIDNKNVTFANLLKKLDNIEGDFWLTFMTSHPKDISKDVIDIMASSKHIFHYLHLPMQSGSDRVLKLMNRKYTSAEYLEKIAYAKSKVKDIEFSSDIIVGFPTETEEDFQDTVRVISEVKFEQLFMFIYSKRKGTVAERLDGQVDLSIKKDRLKRLIAIQNEIGSSVATKYIGKTLKVLITDVHPKKKGYLLGSTFTNKNITFMGDKSLVGKFAMVKVTSSKLTVLTGTLEEIL